MTIPDVVLVDSSGWIELFSDGPGAANFAPAIENIGNLLVPSIVVYEVMRFFTRKLPESTLRAMFGQMRRGREVGVDHDIALAAVDLAITARLAMAGSLILATARQYNAELWTQDSDFDGLPGVRYFAKVS